MTTIIEFEQGEANLDWQGLTKAIEAGHKLPKAEIADALLYRGKDTLLQRQAWVDGLGIAVKSATVFPGNPANDMPLVHGAVTLFDDTTGILTALIDFHLVTKWKTAGDSLLAASKLARPDSHEILIVGAGTVGRSLHAAYSSLFPNARFSVWNRTLENAEKMASEITSLNVVTDLEAAVRQADIVTSATMSTEPTLCGEWFRPGQHIDLIGAYRPDMREADNMAMKRARIFVDSFDTTIDHIGELIAPIEQGAISTDDVLADFYNIGAFQRQSDNEITLFKNGGGAHLDLMTSRFILDRWQAS